MSPMTCEWSQMSRQWSKRQMSNDSNNNNNPHVNNSQIHASQWFDNSFPSKRPKPNEQSNGSSGRLSAVTRQLNGLTTGGGTQSMADDNEDPFNDDLSVFLTQNDIPFDAQPPAQTIVRVTPNRQTPNTGNTRSAFTPAVNGRQMANNPTDEQIDGEIKILRSKNKHLTDELTKYKTRVINGNRTAAVLKKDFKRDLKELEHKFKTQIEFVQSENKTMKDMVQELKRLTALSPKKSQLMISRFLNNPRNTQSLSQSSKSFSQMKLQEFYAPLPRSQRPTASTPLSSGDAFGSQMSISDAITSPDIAVPETQTPSTSRATISGLPSQIMATQRTASPMSWCPQTSASGPESMDIASGPSSRSTVRPEGSTQNISQSQAAKAVWEPIQNEINIRFNRQREELESLWPHQMIHLFDDQWLRNPQEVDEVTESLNLLCVELKVRIIGF